MCSVAQSCGSIIERIADVYFPGKSHQKLRQHSSNNEDLGSVMRIYYLDRDAYEHNHKIASPDEEQELNESYF